MATIPRRVPGFAPAAAAVLLAAAVLRAGPDLNQPPIRYETATPDNAVTRLPKHFAGSHPFEDDRGHLKSVLAALKVPESSQVLVFSKTSLQRGRITPKTPRAIYFNDDVYVGFCLRGDVLEVSAADHDLGTAFYVVDQKPDDGPRFTRQTESCLICHASSSNRGYPGHLVRSVRPDRTGEPILAGGSHRTDPSSPFDERFGGWYVTGRHGKMEHMGNRVFRNARTEYEDPANPNDGQNVTDLRPFFTVGPYLTEHSDLVALLVLTHQADAHNKLARAILETRAALYYQDELNKALREKPGNKFDSVGSRIKSVGDDLVKALFFCDEFKLTDKVEGTSGFAKEFAARGPFDHKGRSLREFDLTGRVFKYRCSYLVYTESFDRMPAELKEYVLRRMYDVLTGKDADKAFAHLTAEDRAAVLEILRDTKPNLPAYWRG